MSEFKVCIIGCGDMGRNHANVWKAREDAEIVSVADPIQERREKLAETTGATPYACNEEAILREGVNVISICTPVCFHSEIGCFAMDHGRHVLCEKPLALTLDQADAMIAAAKRNNVFVSTSFQYRGSARNRKYRELFREGAFGSPIFLRFADVREVRPKIAMHRKSMNGGPIVDMAGHYFDLIRFITSAEPVSVYAQGHVFGKGKPRLAEVDDFAFDAAEVTVTMSGGHILSAFLNWGMPEGFKGYSDEIVAGAALVARPVAEGLELSRGGEKEIVDTSQGNLPGPTVRVNGLISAIRGEAPLEVTGEDGRIALSVSLAAIKSIETGKPVAL